MKFKIQLKKFSLILTLICLYPKISESQIELVSKNSKSQEYNLSNLEWRLWGYRPENWRMDFDFKQFQGNKAEFKNIPAKVPGSVQKALKDAGIIEDWNQGLNSNSIEWIENRHWLFTAKIPDEWITAGNEIILQCSGLDHKGLILVNGKEAGSFNNTFLHYDFNITPSLDKKNNTLAIVFECPPKYLGQIGWTSKIKDWKPRFYYGWDWIPRIVQVGIWDDIRLLVAPKEQQKVENLQIITDADKLKDKGNLKIKATFHSNSINEKVRITLSEIRGGIIFDENLLTTDLVQGKLWTNLNIKRWWPNGLGNQPLYHLNIELSDEQGSTIQIIERRIGFKHTEWLMCKGAPANADPWICSINNQSVFLQGINWTPIRPNFADLTQTDYLQRLTTYKNLGINIIRVWGGGFPEKDWLYNICDELGLLVWQEFPLSSSGLDNYPPEGLKEIDGIAQIVRHYLYRLQYHTSVLLWCAGNELYERGDTAPVTDKHIMIQTMKEWVNLIDPSRRFITGSPSGPNISAGWDNFGSGKNWETHGPWTLPFTKDDLTMEAVRKFWKADDALFHSEVGVAGAMSVEMINKYRGKYEALPANTDNLLWRTVNWWIEWDDYLRDHNGISSANLAEYVNWSQTRQTQGLCIALKSCKDRFPSCGGFILWMGHDSFPCMINTSILDFEGTPKPVAFELSKIWKN